jgi:hypothetical protein
MFPPITADEVRARVAAFRGCLPQLPEIDVGEPQRGVFQLSAAGTAR